MVGTVVALYQCLSIATLRNTSQHFATLRNTSQVKSNDDETAWAVARRSSRA